MARPSRTGISAMRSKSACATMAPGSRPSSGKSCSSRSSRPSRPARAPGSACRSAGTSSPSSTAARSQSTVRLARSPGSPFGYHGGGQDERPLSPRLFATVVVNASFGIITSYGSSSVLCRRVAALRICWRRREAAYFSREQPGEFNRCRIFALRPDDLEGDRQSRSREANWRCGCRQI
jgi:hypothetical protein